MSFPISGISGAASHTVVSGASMSQPPQQKMTSLYNQIDTANAGSISKSQLASAFSSLNPPAVFKNAGVENVFSQLDPNGTGSVSKSDFVSGMKNMMVSLRASTQSLESL